MSRAPAGGVLQAQVLVEGERSGELATASGCRTVRSFAMSILCRSGR
ncbi:MAG TPA: hypothetical protein VNP20_01725 [Nocardioidaceae bacterium]|nr:hypothetical protein [Nocardioidaceae bacterium]